MRVPLLALGVVLAGGVVAAACGGETDTTFGPPNGLVRVSPPTPPSGSGGGSGSSSSSSGSSSSGGSSGSSSGGSSSGSSSGATDGGGSGGSSGSSGSSSGGTTSCAVSWKTQVFVLFESTGSGGCAATNCHGGTSPPTMIDGDPATTYTNMSKYTINGHAVLIPGDTNPADSSLECNMGMSTPACGIQQMPLPPGTLAGAERTTIDTWVRCGSPNN